MKGDNLIRNEGGGDHKRMDAEERGISDGSVN
jgi:hypothetical protein